MGAGKRRNERRGWRRGGEKEEEHGEKKEILRKERSLWKDDIYYYTLLSIAIFQVLHSLKYVPDHSFHYSYLVCITQFLAPAVQSSVFTFHLLFHQHWIFFSHLPPSQFFLLPSFISFRTLDKRFPWITHEERLPIDLTHKCIALNIDFSRCGYVDTQNVIHMCR